MSAERVALSANITTHPHCPNCGALLSRVRRPRSLTQEQFDALKSGDWCCKTCPQRGSADVYFQSSDVEKPEPRWKPFTPHGAHNPDIASAEVAWSTNKVRHVTFYRYAEGSTSSFAWGPHRALFYKMDPIVYEWLEGWGWLDRKCLYGDMPEADLKLVCEAWLNATD